MQFGIDVPWLVEFRNVKGELLGKAICSYRYLLELALPREMKYRIDASPVKVIDLNRYVA